jgi:hypothetical protein
MKITHAQLEKLKADAIARAVPAALRAHNSTAKAIGALNNPPTRTAKADAQAAAAARAMLLRGRTPVPTKDELQAAVGSAMPFKALSDTDQTLAIMRATRAKR